MVFKEPKVEFVKLAKTDITTISGALTGGVDSCDGPASYQRNCSYAGFPDIFHDGQFDDPNWVPLSSNC